MNIDDDPPLDRRQFFRRGVQKIAHTAVQEAQRKFAPRPVSWFRPPFALDEHQFLSRCTRCGDCKDACPHRVVFELGSQFGADVAATPALDLLTTGCRMCADWPCVAACDTGALSLTGRPNAEHAEHGDQVDHGTGEISPPVVARARIDPSRCLPYLGPECGACAASCPIPEALVWDGPKPAIDPDHCTGCALCRQVCIVDPKAVLIELVQSRSCQGETA
jgi:ferredoxin-type protein NapG